MLPVSNDPLLRTIGRRAARPAQFSTVIGIDDWAYKRGQRYGTLVCDLEHRQVVTLLPNRDDSTVEAWLSQRPEISIIARATAAEVTARPPGGRSRRLSKLPTDGT